MCGSGDYRKLYLWSELDGRLGYLRGVRCYRYWRGLSGDCGSDSDEETRRMMVGILKDIESCIHALLHEYGG